MSMIATSILYLHILAGFTALLTGGIAIATKKGKGKHVVAGRIYFWAMVVVATTALWLAVLRPNFFLLFISLFSFFLTWSGYKAIYWKNKPLTTTAALFNNILIPVFLLIGLSMVIIPVLGWTGIPIPERLDRLSIVLIVFGIIFCLTAGAELKHLLKPNKSNKFWWMYRHIGSMLGAYIATFTAFLVVNGDFLPQLVAWLGPTVVITPVISYWIRKYRIKLEGHQ
jgi:uncharacterized membrane protein